MAYSTGAQIAISKDSPLFVVENIINTAGSGKWTTAVEKSASDVTDADFPAARAYDWHGHLPTKSDAALGTTFYLHFDCRPASTTYPYFNHAVDIIAIIGHNFAEQSGGVNVEIHTADDDTYETGSPGNNHIQIHDFGTVTLNDRLIGHPSTRYTSLDRIRIKMEKNGGGNFSVRPEITEVIIGAHYQFDFQSDQGAWDNRELRSRVTQHETKSGVITRYARKKGQGFWRLQTLIDDGTGVSDLQRHRRSWERADQGTGFGLYIPEPNTALANAHIVTMPTGLYHPYVGPVARSRSFTLAEQLPYRVTEDSGAQS